MKQNLRRAVNLTALVLAAGLLIGLLAGCFGLIGPKQHKPKDNNDDTGIFEVTFEGSINGYKCTKEELPANLVIPDKIGNKVITGISRAAFYGCTGLTSIDLSGCTSLTEIGEKAFSYCSNLAGTIVFPASLKTIKSYKYKNFYGIGAFEGCIKLQGADFSACTNFTKIENSTFKNCTSLTEVKLPASLTEIEEKAFKGCTGLTSAVFADKEGWKAGSISISSALDNAATAAEYLRETYVDDYWKKN